MGYPAVNSVEKWVVKNRQQGNFIIMVAVFMTKLSIVYIAVSVGRLAQSV